MRAGSTTITGRTREHNEDAILVADPVFAVADGMGGHRAGEVASRTVLDIVKQSLLGGAGGDDIVAKIAVAIESANAAVRKDAQDFESFYGMGTTVTIAYIKGTEIFMGHVGDSRAYLYSPGELVQITHDHSLVGEMVREGQLSKDTARTHPSRNIITQAIGTSENLIPDMLSMNISQYNKLLLCTDGLTAMLSDAAIAAAVAKDTDPQAICDELAAQADLMGGIDNVSLILIDFGRQEM